MPVRKHEANHPLPISNGWSSHEEGDSPAEVTVQCGRCKDAYTPDEEWVDRYYTSKRAPHENGKAYSPKHRRRLNDEENREALAALAEERDRLLDLIR